MLDDLRELLVPIWYRRKTSNPTSSRIRTGLMAKESLMEKTRPHRLPTSRRRQSIRRKDPAMSVVILIIGLLAAPIALTSVHMEIVASPLMLSLVILR